MSGLLALLDDVAGIAKVAAASVDDVAAQALKAGSKAAGALIDDAAVTPKYLHGFAASRELPIVWKISKGSLKNKLLFLLPIGLLLSAFAPWAIPPLLMIGGCYLCFEGAEKVAHVFSHKPHKPVFPEDKPSVDPAKLEETKVAGAIKTDFILSAEIMTIALSTLDPGSIWVDAVILAVVAVGITVVVYGSVALIVKADDVGLHMATEGRLGATRTLGRGVVRIMPHFLKLLTIVGTAAMLWVGGDIVLHGFEQLGFGWPDHQVIHLAEMFGTIWPEGLAPALTWIAKATMDGIFGLALGFVLLPIFTRFVPPIWKAVTGHFPTE